MTKSFFEKISDEVSGEKVEFITEEGRIELKRLEAVYCPMMSAKIKDRFSHYTEEEKLHHLIGKDYREKKKETPMVTEHRTDIKDYLLKRHSFNWEECDDKDLSTMKEIFLSYAEDIEFVENFRLLEKKEKIENELSLLNDEISQRESKRIELQNALVKLGAAV